MGLFTSLLTQPLFKPIREKAKKTVSSLFGRVGGEISDIYQKASKRGDSLDLGGNLSLQSRQIPTLDTEAKRSQERIDSMILRKPKVVVGPRLRKPVPTTESLFKNVFQSSFVVNRMKIDVEKEKKEKKIIEPLRKQPRGSFELETERIRPIVQRIDFKEKEKPKKFLEFGITRETIERITPKKFTKPDFLSLSPSQKLTRVKEATEQSFEEGWFNLKAQGVSGLENALGNMNKLASGIISEYNDLTKNLPSTNPFKQIAPKLFDTIGDVLIEHSKKRIQDKPKYADPMFFSKKEGMEGVVENLKNNPGPYVAHLVAGQAPTTLAIMTSAFFSGGWSAVALMGAPAAGETFVEAQKFGDSRRVALTKAVVRDIIEGKLETIGFKGLFPDIDIKTLKKVSSNYTEELFKQLIKNGDKLRGLATEELTEFLQNTFGNILAKTYDENRKIFDKKEIIETALSTLGMTGGIQAIQSTLEARQAGKFKNIKIGLTIEDVSEKSITEGKKVEFSLEKGEVPYKGVEILEDGEKIGEVAVIENSKYGKEIEAIKSSKVGAGKKIVENLLEKNDIYFIQSLPNVKEFWEKMGVNNFKLNEDSGLYEGVLKKETFKAKKEPVFKKQEGFTDIGYLTLKTIKSLEGKTTVSKQFISDLSNKGDIKQTERDLIRRVLEDMPEGKIDVKEFADRVKTELVPLKVDTTEETFDTTGESTGRGGRFENITLPNEIRGNIANYYENVYQSPIKTSAGKIHFGGEGFENYFAHTRIEDLASSLSKPDLPMEEIGDLPFQKANKLQALRRKAKQPLDTRRIIEIQSDLFQKGMLEKEGRQSKEILESGDYAKILEKESETGKFIINEAKQRQTDIKKLQPYRNTWWERIIKEEVKQAAKDNKTKLQFPTGETAMNIEGLGQEDVWSSEPEGGAFEIDFNWIKDRGRGESIYRDGEEWIEIDVKPEEAVKPITAFKKADGIDRVEAEAMIKKAIEEYGLTDVHESIGFITPKGKAIDSSGQKQGAFGEGRNVDHREIAQDALPEDSEIDDGTDALIEFMNKTNVIRVKSAGPNGLNIDMVDLPTDKQMDLLRRMFIVSKGQIFADISTATGGIAKSGEFNSFNQFERFVEDFFGDKKFKKKGKRKFAFELTREEAEEVISNILGVQLRNKLITSPKLPHGALGFYVDTFITLLEKSGSVSEFVAIHESYHFAEDIFLDEKEVKKMEDIILKDFKDKIEKQRSRYAKDNLTDRELAKEVLADELAVYHRTGKSLTERLKAFFDKMLQGIEFLFKGKIEVLNYLKSIQNLSKKARERATSGKISLKKGFVDEGDIVKIKAKKKDGRVIKKIKITQVSPDGIIAIDPISDIPTLFKADEFDIIPEKTLAEKKAVMEVKIEDKAKLARLALESKELRINKMKEFIEGEKGFELQNKIDSNLRLREDLDERIVEGIKRSPYWIKEKGVKDEMGRGWLMTRTRNGKEQYMVATPFEARVNTQGEGGKMLELGWTPKLEIDSLAQEQGFDNGFEWLEKQIELSEIPKGTDLKREARKELLAQDEQFRDAVAIGERFREKKVNEETLLIERAKKEKLIKRRAKVRAIRDFFELSDNELKQVSGVDPRLMGEKQFEDYLKKLELLSIKFAEKRQAKNELINLIQRKKFKNWESLQKVMKFPTIKNMTKTQLNQFADVLDKYQVGDQFLSTRKLELVDRTNLKGIKTYREAKEKMAKELGIDVDELQNIKATEFDRMKFDTALADTNPFYKMMVEEFSKEFFTQEAEFLIKKKEFNKLLREVQKGVGVVGMLVPQQKKVIKYIESDPAKKPGIAKTMSSAELDLAHFMIGEYRGVMEYQAKIESEFGSRFNQDNYFTHVRRGILETIKEDGPIQAIKEIFSHQKEEEAVFNILDGDTGNILALEKFFKFSQFRSGNIKPSENVSRAFLSYMQAFHKKKALDRVVPKIDIYAHTIEPKESSKRGLQLDRGLQNFVKEWINNKKGRRTKVIGKQFGKIDLSIRAIKMFVTLLDLGLNIPIGIATQVGEKVTTFQMLGKKNFVKGTTRKHTKQGRAIAKKYENFIGESVWSKLIEPSVNIEDRLMLGLFALFNDASVRANRTFLLGSMSETEFKAGEVTPDRLATMRTRLGDYRIVEGGKSILGSTAEGGILIHYKTWAIPILTRTGKNIASLLRTVTRLGDKGKRLTSEQSWELYRIIEITVVVLAITAYLRADDEDDTFIGQIRKKVLREAMTLLGALSPKLYLGTPRVIKFLSDLGKNLDELIKLEEYKTDNKKGQLKGSEHLLKQFTPRAIKQFSKKEEGLKTKAEIKAGIVKERKKGFLTPKSAQIKFNKEVEKAKKKDEDVRFALTTTKDFKEATIKSRKADLITPKKAQQQMNKFTKELKEKESLIVKGDDERSIIEKVILYAKATANDPISAFKALLTDEKIAKVVGDAVIFERKIGAEESGKIKKERGFGSVQKDVKLDHKVPLQLGGDNSQGNLTIVTTREWKEYTPVENYLGRKFKTGDIKEKQARELIEKFKAGDITFDEIKKLLP